MSLNSRPLPLILFCTALSLSSPAAAQDNTCRRHSIIVNVTTRDGYHIPGLEPSHFRATVGGKQASVLSVARVAAPQRVVLVLDASGSMLAASKWKLVRLVAQEFLKLLPPETPVALLAFGGKKRIVVDFTQGRAAVESAFANLGDDIKLVGKALGGNTPLLDNILAGLGLLRSPADGDLIYVITDDGGARDMGKKAAVLGALLSAHVRLFAFIFDDRLPGNPSSVGGSELIALTQATGGDSGIATAQSNRESVYDTGEGSLQGIALIARRLYSEMMTFYKIEVESGKTLEKPQRWKLEVVPPASFKKAGWQVLYPSRLLPCAQP